MVVLQKERDASNRETRSTILLSFPFHVAPRDLSICLANVQANSEIRVITWSINTTPNT